jgi:MerR family mercuric resistance operon transcriptional regulator
MSGMSIGKAAERSGCTVAAVRHYEAEGLLKRVSRAANGRRVYGCPEIHRLRFVRRCRDLGFGLDEVKALVGATDAESPDCLAVRDLAVSHDDCRNYDLKSRRSNPSTLAATRNAACAAGPVTGARSWRLCASLGLIAAQRITAAPTIHKPAPTRSQLSGRVFSTTHIHASDAAM